MSCCPGAVSRRAWADPCPCFPVLHYILGESQPANDKVFQ